MDSTPSEEDLIEGLQSFAEEVNGVPTVRGMRTDGPYPPYYYKDRFGSWHGALRAADIQPTHGVDVKFEREDLLEDLQRVNEITDRAPRRADVDEHGEYPYDAYDEEFDSFIHALKEADIEPDEKQYRFSSVDTPEEKKGSANIELLQNNGPTPASELPQGVSTKDRERGVWKFTLDSGSTQPATQICYLHGDHAPELVIRRFFEENPHVLEYQDPHAIKLDIGNHRSSWKVIGQDIVDELVEEGDVSLQQFENLIVVRITQDDTLSYCFETSISTSADLADLPFGEIEYTDKRPVWGFSRESEDIWQAVSEYDGLLFSTRSGTFTHYMQIAETVENTDVMSDLWIEYGDDGIRTGGIERPLRYIVIGSELQEISLPEEELIDEIDSSLNREPIQWLDETELEPLLNSYGSFESYLRNRKESTDITTSGASLDEDSSPQDVVESLLDLHPAELPMEDEHPAVEAVERHVREDAFREGIYQLYSGCAICGQLFEAPDGSIDLEAAHILPKANQGPDVLQNGLGLCSRHHWAFDHGWFRITSDYEIRVPEYPELEGYSELSQYDGTYLQLPSQEQMKPHPQYIRQRNQN